MGYYKRLESAGRRSGKRFKTDIDLLGLEDMQKKLLRLQKFGKPGIDERVGKLHKRYAHNIARKLKRRVTDAKDDIVVWGRNPELVVERGTLKRSVGFWKPKGSQVDHLYFVGPRTGKKVAPKRDAWFQLIVEQDEQYVDGNNRNKYIFEKFYNSEMPGLRKALLDEYKKLLIELGVK